MNQFMIDLNSIRTRRLVLLGIGVGALLLAASSDEEIEAASRKVRIICQ